MDLRVLLVCPDQDSANLLSLILPELGMVAEHTPSFSRALQQLNEQRFDAIILDYRSDPGSQEFLSRWRQSSKNRDTMLIAVVDGEFSARPAFGMGAHFVLYRPLSAQRTRVSLRAARGLMRHERRRAPRIPLKSPATLAYPGAGELISILNDLSEGGTSLTTSNRFPPACKVYFEFALPGQQQHVRLSGEVAWQDSTGRTGIRFLDVPQTSRRLMQAWLRQSTGQTQEQPGRPPASVSASDHTSANQTTNPGLTSNASNRRGKYRIPCKIGAEIYSPGSSVPNRCTLSDLSEGGCYVEMPSPLSVQSGVEILVRTAEVKLKIRGQVLAAHPGFGMGVRFMFRDSAEREEILQLLAVLAAGPSLDEISL
jgi:CheY-like chemotaxis protein